MRLKELRLEKNLTQAELAKQIGTSQPNIGRWENGENEPTSSFLVSLANFFGVSVDELLGRDEVTLDEKTAGASITRKATISPQEDDLLYAFRELGKQRGKAAQQAVVDMLEKMLN
jgi:transcriptional regulator with XRE-family HTH domain